jgi:hypothetical protein
MSVFTQLLVDPVPAPRRWPLSVQLFLNPRHSLRTDTDDFHLGVRIDFYLP